VNLFSTFWHVLFSDCLGQLCERGDATNLRAVVDGKLNELLSQVWINAWALTITAPVEVGLQAPHRPGLGLQEPVVGLDPIVGILLVSPKAWGASSSMTAG
jgi:hypothetical protein